MDPNGDLAGDLGRAKDLTKISAEAMPNVRVCSTRSLQPNIDYFTLSHRWDSPPSIPLTNDSLAAFPTEIPFHLLCKPGAKVFRDAIAVVRALGHRYLWIDSLCINQDDEVEKASEIAFMDQIYANALANISATGAARGSDGLFF